MAEALAFQALLARYPPTGAPESPVVRTIAIRSRGSGSRPRSSSRTWLRQRIAGIGNACDDRRVLATTLDPDGRRVVLTEARWRHIKEDHAELSRHMGEIMSAVREPDRRMAGRKPDEEWFFLERAGRSRWLHVVVHYEGDEGWIVTAFPRAGPPW